VQVDDLLAYSYKHDVLIILSLRLCCMMRMRLILHIITCYGYIFSVKLDIKVCIFDFFQLKLKDTRLCHYFHIGYTAQISSILQRVLADFLSLCDMCMPL